jgi:hypothetical protein
VFDALIHSGKEQPVREALFVSVEEAAQRIGIGRTLAYSLCRTFESSEPGGP